MAAHKNGFIHTHTQKKKKKKEKAEVLFQSHIQAGRCLSDLQENPLSMTFRHTFLQEVETETGTWTHKGLCCYVAGEAKPHLPVLLGASHATGPAGALARGTG